MRARVSVRHTLLWWVEGLVAVVAVSCGAAYSYLRLPAGERRLFEQASLVSLERE